MSVEVPKKVGYVRLGKSGLKVSKIILGGMSYGKKSWSEWILDEEDGALEHFKAAYDLGINTWDTANTYSNGHAEVLLGKAIKKYTLPREELVIMTKLFFPVQKDVNAHPSGYTDLDGTGYVNLHGSSRKNIFAALKASLERMDLEYVDVIQLHRFDYNTPIEETMDALHDVVKLGLARYIGMSSCFAYQFHAMQNYALSRNQTAFISMQNFYNCIYREEEREMMPTLDHFGVGSICWSPLARGYLTRPHIDQDTTRAKTDRNYGKFVGLGTSAEEDLKAINEAVEKVAKDRGLTMAQISLAWCLANKTVTAPIIGTTKLESLAELAAATHIILTEEEITAISTPYKPRAISGHA